MPTKKPKVSVVLTIYNGEKYFHNRAIPSILKQNYDNYEFIIVDDGSTDKTPSLLEKLEQENKKARVFFPGRLGRAKALNFAVDKARGKYIAIQDLDDTSTSNRLKIQAGYLDKNPEIGMVGGYYQLIDKNRDEKYLRMPPLEHKELITAMSKYIPFAHTVVMFRKEAWQQVGGYPDVKNIIDLRMWINFAEKGWKLANIPENIGTHWVYTNSYWHKKFKYKKRQRELAGVQLSAVKKLNLPLYYYTYPFGRLFYAYFPDNIKRFIRRKIAGSKEDDR
ncbi:MAG: glycosyltransferase family 2 protein [Halothermotrichaceae bacterium]